MKKFILFLSTFFLFGLSSCTVNTDVRPIARALDNEEEIASSQVVEEESTSSYEEEIGSSQITEEDKATLIGKAANWIEEKVVPIFGFLTIGNVLTVVGFIVTLVMKFKGEKKYKTERKTDNDNYTGLVTALTEKVISLENKVAELETADSKRSDDYTKMAADVEKIITTAKDVVDVAEKQNENIGSVVDMKRVIEVSCKLMAKSMSLSEDAVKKGVAEEALKLIKTIEGGNSDGGKEN